MGLVSTSYSTRTGETYVSDKAYHLSPLFLFDKIQLLTVYPIKSNQITLSVPHSQVGVHRRNHPGCAATNISHCHRRTSLYC